MFNPHAIKLREAKLEKLLVMVGRGTKLVAACHLLGFTRASVYKHRDQFPEFAERLKDAMAGKPICCPHCGEKVV